MGWARDIDNWLAAANRGTEGLLSDIRSVDVELEQLGEQRLRLEELLVHRPSLRLDPNLPVLRDQLDRDRDALQLRWARLVLAFRDAGGTVQLHIPSAAFAQLHAAEGSSSGPSADLRTFPIRTPSSTGDDIRNRRLEAARSEASAARPVASAKLDPVRWQELVTELCEPPTNYDDEAVIRAEFRRLDRMARPEKLQFLAELPREMQRLLIGHLVARARCMQEPPARNYLVELEYDKPVDHLFSAWTAFQRDYRPGFVHGLSRQHVAEHGENWSADAHWFWQQMVEFARESSGEVVIDPLRDLQQLSELVDQGSGPEALISQLDHVLKSGVAQEDRRLVRLLTPFPEVTKLSRFKVLKRAIRALEQDAEAEDEQEAGQLSLTPTEGLPWTAIRGKRVTIVGGQPRESSRARVAAYFGCSAVQWLSPDSEKNANLLDNPDFADQTDVALFLEIFANDQLSAAAEQACKQRGIAFVSVAKGYTVGRIRDALEQIPEAMAQTDEAA